MAVVNENNNRNSVVKYNGSNVAGGTGTGSTSSGIADVFNSVMTSPAVVAQLEKQAPMIRQFSSASSALPEPNPIIAPASVSAPVSAPDGSVNQDSGEGYNGGALATAAPSYATLGDYNNAHKVTSFANSPFGLSLAAAIPGGGLLWNAANEYGSKVNKGYSNAVNDKEGGNINDSFTPSPAQTASMNTDYNDYGTDYGGSSNGDSGGGCFITTAACEVMGLPDGCDELQTLRQFRDDYMMKTHEGRALVDQYYAEAPSIIDAIDDNETYERFFNVYIKPAVKLIKRGEYVTAERIYTQLFNHAKFCAGEL